MEKKSKKLPGVAIALIILLAIRALGQLATAFLVGGGEAVIYFVLGAIYVAALYGVVKRKIWAPILVIVIGVVDAAAAIFALSGPEATGAILMDALLITLAIFDKKKMEGGGKTSAPLPPKKDTKA